MTRRARDARGAALLVLALALAGAPSCRNRPGAGGGEGDPVAQLVRGGQYDEAIARLGERSDPESLYLLGLAWAGKARSAPLPTPAPGRRPVRSSGSPKSCGPPSSCSARSAPGPITPERTSPSPS